MPKSKPDRFETLIAPHLATLFRAAYRLAGNVADAEDLVQDVCAAVGEKLDALAAADHADRWLVRVLYNRFVDGARREQRSPVVLFQAGADLALPASAEPGPAELALQGESERAFERACASLGDTQRALLSFRAEGYGLAEIEEMTGISRDVLRARLHRARLSLARYLEQQNDEAETLSRLGSGQ